MERGVPDRLARHVPPGVRPDRRGGRRTDMELRRLRHYLGDLAGRRQQEGGLHARPPAEGGRARGAPALARRCVSTAIAPSRAEAPDQRPAGLRLTEYLGYGAGDAANNLAFAM